MSGVSILAYWLSNYALDIIKYLIAAIFCVFMCRAFSIDALVDDWGATWLVFILYGFSLISFTYMFSFIFKDFGNGQLMIFFLFFIIGAIGPIAFFVLRLIESSRDIVKPLSWVIRLLPSFSFGYGIVNISNR